MKDDRTIHVEVWLNKPCGSAFYSEEKAVIFFQADADGYVTLYDIDTSGNVLVIFPIVILRIILSEPDNRFKFQPNKRDMI